MKKTANYLNQAFVFTLLAAFCVLSATAQTSRSGKTDYGSMLSNLRFREIGPAVMGGRIDDFAVVESNPSIVYAGTASGGIWKTINGGNTWAPIFDNEAVSTIGDLALAPSDPSILWVGTGEANHRQSSSWGNGVYKTLDGGRTWQYMGLPETHHIGRIVIHPTNPDIVYVAAVGKLWGANKERGVYKTTDGGKNWQQILFVNEDTGINDIAIDTQSPGTLYAASFQRRRTVFGFNGSGPGSALYKTTDGGATWKKLTKGLPYDTENAPQPLPATALETGRIGITVYRKDPNIVYALVEHANGGTFRSNDKGETWTRMSETNPRPMYYSQIHIDPNNDQRIWTLGAPLYFSEDGGRNYATTRGQRIHSDFHAFWIDPNDSNHILAGSDGGIHQSYDQGRSWDFINTIPLAQFYEIGVDMSKPYKICGGLQDNNTWCGPSMSFNPRGISNSDWYTIGGGDGFYAQPDPNDPDIVYAESQDGNLLRRNTKTGENRSIRPQPADGEKPYRFQWNSPIVISAYNSNTIYYGGNFLFKSTNRGDAWTKVSPDLTTDVDRNTLPIMGKVPDKNTRSRHDGVQQFPTITSVSESPLDAKVLWAGTDDGNLQVTRDGGTSWKNVVGKVSNLPKGTYVSRVIASKFNAGTAYATFDGHRNGDFKVYVYMTSDFGDNWKSIVSDLPQNNGIANVIREHPRNANLLFVGTEFGAYVSFDRGGSWTKIKMNLPTVPVDDIVIHPRENDLIFGTHGRSIWIMDDITPLEQMNETVVASDLFLFDVRPPTMWRTWSNTGDTGHKVFMGENPPNGAIINFYLKAPLKDREQVRISIVDAQGQAVRELTCGRRAAPNPQAAPQTPQPGQGGVGGGGQGGGFGGFGGGGQGQCEAKPGLNRVVWDMRARSVIPQFGAGGGGGGGGGGFGGGGGNRPGFRVDPGSYTVKVKLGEKEVSKTLTLGEDPRVNMTADDRAKRREALRQLTPVLIQAATAQFTITTVRTTLNTTIESWKRPGAPNVPDNVKKAAEDLLKRIDEAYPNWGTPPSEQATLGNAGPPVVERPAPFPQRVQQLVFGIEGYSAAPTENDLAQIQNLSARVKEASDIVRKFAAEDLPALNKMMAAAGIPYINLPIPVGGGQRPPE
jgi:photosystem II stability/assembly factor-like uncharacterized protein